MVTSNLMSKVLLRQINSRQILGKVTKFGAFRLHVKNSY